MPLASPVRTMAARSLACRPVSTNWRRARRMLCTPSTESPRSSTTRRNVRGTCSRIIGGAAGTGTEVDPIPLAVESAPVTRGTNSANVTFCRLPSWRISKSAAVRSRTTSPWRSVTTTSMDTTSTATLNLAGCEGAWLAATAAAAHPTTMSDTRAGGMVRTGSRQIISDPVIRLPVFSTSTALLRWRSTRQAASPESPRDRTRVRAVESGADRCSPPTGGVSVKNQRVRTADARMILGATMVMVSG